MKDTERLTELRYSMERGRELLDSGNPRAALLHFVNLTGDEFEAEQRVRALQMSGVCFRLIGQHENAVGYLKRAKDLLRSINNNARLRAAIHRDFGAALNKLGLVQKSEEILDEALKEFDKSISILTSVLNKIGWSFQDYKALRAEKAATQGFRGLLLFEMGVKSTGVEDIANADTTLFNLGQNFETYQLNNLVRLIRVSSTVKRWHLLAPALKLTSKSSGSHSSRKRVWLAMLGNRLYRRFE